MLYIGDKERARFTRPLCNLLESLCDGRFEKDVPLKHVEIRGPETNPTEGFARKRREFLDLSAKEEGRTRLEELLEKMGITLSITAEHLPNNDWHWL
ncbi:hypothetical protein BT69DRAFT_1289895 [Atractiella rhizophila]|nr:hypothetical protein BT69DRAFT_1289895 [Atractiella rhizophila]